MPFRHKDRMPEGLLKMTDQKSVVCEGRRLQCNEWIVNYSFIFLLQKEFILMGQKEYAEILTEFYRTLKPPPGLPAGIEVLFPQQCPETMKVIRLFFKKFYDDPYPRRLIFGINPGRFGAGTTGINFTAPRQLKEFCGIDHPFKNQSELSAEFIYEMIQRYGSVKKFYSEWFISAVCPLGFVTSPGLSDHPLQGRGKISPGLSDHPLHRRGKGKNINYYDDKKLMMAVTPFIISSIRQQVDMGFKTDYCICVGGEKNFKFFNAFNEEHGWFDRIIPLPHPRFIMQYRRRQKEKFVHQYLNALQQGH
jgi:hypothetical protein